MENLEELLKTVEKNFLDKDKKETVNFTLRGKEYEVLLFTRSEKAEMYFSKKRNMNEMKEIYEWIKPFIYKAFQLKEVAKKAKEEGYINTYYEIVDMLFEPEDIPLIVDFIFKANRMEHYEKEEIELQKKQ